MAESIALVRNQTYSKGNGNLRERHTVITFPKSTLTALWKSNCGKKWVGLEAGPVRGCVNLLN